MTLPSYFDGIVNDRDGLVDEKCESQRLGHCGDEDDNVANRSTKNWVDVIIICRIRDIKKREIRL